ncbi:serine aminopeptidase domain-containing protein [Sphingomonas sp. MMS24-JH45]
MACGGKDARRPDRGARHGRAFRALPRAAGAARRAGSRSTRPDHRGHGATASEESHGDFGPGGFAALVDDLAVLTRRAAAEHPGAVVVLLGHSMGSLRRRRAAAPPDRRAGARRIDRAGRRCAGRRSAEMFIEDEPARQRAG